MKTFLISMLLVSSAIPTGSVFADFGSIVQNVQGVDSDVKGSITDLNNRVLDIFKKEGIQQTGIDTENAGAKQTIKGKKDNMDVQVLLTPGASGQTHVSVTAKTGLLNWNKDFAQNVLSKIIQAS